MLWTDRVEVCVAVWSVCVAVCVAVCSAWASACSAGGMSCRMIMDLAFLWRSAWAWLLAGESDSSGSLGSAPGLKLERDRASALEGGGGGRKDGGGPESRRKSVEVEEAEGGGGGAV